MKTKSHILKVFLLLSVSLLPLLLPCVNATGEELTAKNYENNKNTMGVVLVAVNWGRQWQCGKYENAQLESLEFERLADNDKAKHQPSVLALKSPSRIFVKPEFKNYGFLIEPGQYALADFSVKVAKSVRDVGYINARKEELVKNGVAEGGSFAVGAGEVVYIGNFFLDCYQEPMPWRYYSQGKDGFGKHVAEFKEEYQFLADKKVIFRLFKTQSFGKDYELPNE